MSLVEFQCEDHIAVITLNRPELHNTINPEMIVKLLEIWARVQEDDEIRVAILTGAGEKAFSAGADLAALIPLVTGARKPQNVYEEFVAADLGSTRRALLRELDPGKPVIAAINGLAIGSGMEVIQGTDLRVCAPHARFGQAEVKWGLFPRGGTTARLPRQVPYVHAMEIALTGNLIDAARAYEIGFLNYVVPAAEVMGKARELARAIAANGPLAVQATRRAIRECAGRPELEALALEFEIGSPIFTTEDAREGPRAFAEKRPPNYRGR